MLVFINAYLVQHRMYSMQQSQVFYIITFGRMFANIIIIRMVSVVFTFTNEVGKILHFTYLNKLIITIRILFIIVKIIIPLMASSYRFFRVPTRIVLVIHGFFKWS